MLTAFEQVTGISVKVSQGGHSQPVFSRASPASTPPSRRLQKLLADTGLILPLYFGHRCFVGSEDVATSVEVTTSVDALAASFAEVLRRRCSTRRRPSPPFRRR